MSSDDTDTAPSSTRHVIGTARDGLIKMWQIVDPVDWINSKHAAALKDLKMMTGRIWKICRRFTDYAVASTGIIHDGVHGYDQVWSFKSDKMLTLQDESGYWRASLYRDNVKYATMVHQLVAEEFISVDTDENKTVDHIDSDRKNNDVDNLRMATKSEQVIYQGRNGIGGPSRKVLQFKMSGEFVGEFESVLDAAQSMKHAGSAGNIASVARGERKAALGYIWEYADEDLDGETWMEVKLSDYIGYQVSSHGRLKDRRGRKSSGHSSAGGYRNFHLGSKMIRAHILLMMVVHFGEGIDWSVAVVNHKDGNRSNNHLTNLEIVTQKENSQHAYRKDDHPNLVPVEGRKFGTNGEWKRWRSCAAAARELKVTECGIYNVLAKRQKTTGNYEWRRA